MRELLERWSRLEPERCMSGPPTTHICVVVQVGDIDIFHDGAHTVMLDRPSAKQRALLLAAVIEAIEARGWDYRLSSSTPQPGMTHAIVWTGASRPGTRTYRPSHDAHGDTPAAALLGAYLAALEAESVS